MAEFDFTKIAVPTIGCPLFDWVHLPVGTGVARAILTEGLATAESRPRSIQTLEEFSTAGYDGGFMLIQSIGPKDEAELDLAEFDAMRTRFLEYNGHRQHIGTAYQSSSITSLVVVAFRKPPSPVAAGFDLYPES
jgi:hypothetical protein